MNKETTLAIPCECCGSNHNGEVATKRGWRLRRCDECACVFVWPQPGPQELKDIYNKSEGYFTTAASDLSKTSAYAANELHNQIQKIRPSSKSILDVGCATGKTIYHLRDLGWSVFGCDLNSRALTIARASGLDVYEGTVENSPYPPHSFDVINMADVIEHVASPGAVIAATYNLLKPGGLLKIRTPNSQCSFATSTLYLSKLTGFPYPQSEAPYHLFEFSPKGLKALLQNQGFDVVTTELRDKTSFKYAVGATGLFDGLKVHLKSSGEYKMRSAVIGYLPRLTAVTALLLPFHLYGRLMDPIRKSGSAINIIARSRFQ